MSEANDARKSSGGAFSQGHRDANWSLTVPYRFVALPSKDRKYVADRVISIKIQISAR
jgi:hypothetical protein